MNVFKKCGLIVVLSVTAFWGWSTFVRDPGRVDNTLFHPDKFQIAADTDGQPIPEIISTSRSFPVRFRCPVPAGLTRQSRFAGYLYVVNPETYRDADVTDAFQQIPDVTKISMLVAQRDVTPKFPEKDDDCLQFCALLSPMNLKHAKPGVPLEMHLWLFPLEDLPYGQVRVGPTGEWVFRHAFEFTEDLASK